MRQPRCDQNPKTLNFEIWNLELAVLNIGMHEYLISRNSKTATHKGAFPNNAMICRPKWVHKMAKSNVMTIYTGDAGTPIIDVVQSANTQNLHHIFMMDNLEIATSAFHEFFFEFLKLQALGWAFGDINSDTLCFSNSAPRPRLLTGGIHKPSAQEIKDGIFRC